MNWRVKPCPRCGGDDIRPSSQGGRFRWLFRLIGRRPVRCHLCEHVFWRVRPSSKARAGDREGKRIRVIGTDMPTPLPGAIPPPADQPAAIPADHK